MRRLFIFLLLATFAMAQQEKLGGTGGAGGIEGFQGYFTVTPPLSVATNALADGAVGSAYTQTLAANNGTAPLSWTILFGSLPPGLTLASATGVISGTPTALGNYLFTVLVTDSTSPTHLIATKDLSIAITCSPLAIVSSATLPPALVGTAYNFQFNSSGGQGTVTWAASGLSPPYSLSSSGLLSGTPTAANTQTFTVTATDSCPVPQSAQQIATLVTNSTVQIVTTSPLPNGQQSTAYSQQFNAQGGTAPYTWAVTAGSLPNGLALSSGGALTGTPTVLGAFSFTIRVTDNAANTSTAPFTLAISCSTLAVTTATLPNGAQGVPYSFQLTRSGGVSPFTWSAAGLPNGLNVSTGGAITGTPTQTGSFTPRVTVTDSCSTVQSASADLALDVFTGLTITTNSTLPAGTVGTAYSANMTAVGGFPPYQWSVPSGPFASGAEDILDYAIMPVGVRSNFHLTGTAYKAFRLDAGLIWWLKGQSGGPWDGEMLGKDYVSQWFTEGPTFNNLSGFKMYVNPVPLWKRYHVPGADDIVYTPGPNRYSTTESCGTDNLPLIDNLGVRGELTGPFTDITWQTTYGGNIPDHTPYLLAQKWIKCTANNIANCTTEEDYWLVQGWGQVRWVPKSCSAGVCTPTSSGSVNTIEVGGGAPVPNFACKVPNVPVQGMMPPGVTSTQAPQMDLAANTGVISGTPIAAASNAFTVQVEDSVGTITQQDMTMVTACPAISLASTSPLPLATQGQAYNFQFSANGGIAPLTWSVIQTQGLPPNGITLSSSGVLSGTPTQTGVFQFVVQAVDSCSPTQSVQSTFQLSVQANSGPLAISTTTPLPLATESTAYNQQIAASGGTPPYTFVVTVGTLPAGLAMSSTGLITGTPTTAGTSSFTVRVTDALSVTATKVFTLTVACPSLTISTASLPGGTVSSAYSFQFTSAGGIGSKSWALASGALPTGLSLASSGALTGTPAVAGTSSFSVKVTDSCSPTGQTVTSSTLTLVINPAPIPLAITTGATLPAGVVGAAYSTQVNATGGTTPYTWTSTGTLPGGLAISSAGIISGTPTTAGSFNFPIKVTDAVAATVSQSENLVVSCPAVQINSTSPLPNGVQGDVYTNFQFTATGGILPLTWTVASGSFPTGMSMNSSGVLSGTPSASGTFTVGITATDSCSPTHSTNTHTFILNIIPALTITTASPLQAGTEGVAYSVTLSATGGTTPYAWSLISGSLPPGLVLGGTTPTGTCLVALPAGSGTHSGADWNNALIGLPSTLVRGNTYYLGDGAYSAYNFTTTGTTLTTIKKAIASDNCTNTGWNAGTMGASQAVFSGTPTAWNSTGAGNYTIDGQTGTGETGSTYGIKLLNAGTCGVSGGCGGKTFVLDNNVPNVTVKHVEIQGGGLGAGADATEHLIWMQGTGALLDHIFAHDSECDFMQGYGPGNFTVQYSSFYRNGNGGGSPHCQVMWANGMNNITWRFNSIHDVGGSALWTFATGSCLSPCLNNNINIYGNWIWLSNPPSSGSSFAGIGDGVFACINAGVICTNVRFYNNTIALMKQYNGQAMNSGNFLQNSGDFFTSQNNLYFNNNGNSGTYATTPTVDHNSYLGTGGTDSRCTTACVSNAGASDPFVASSTGNFQLAAEGANVSNWFALATPYNVDALGNLRTSDRGVYQFNGSPVATSPVGTISGTPTLTGTYNFTIQVTDAVAATATKAFQFVVSCTPLAIVSTSPIPNAAQGQAYSFQFTSSGGTGAVSWTGTSIPAGLTLSASGALTGTPTGSGSASLSVTATDSCLATHQTASGTFSLTTTASPTPVAISTTSPLPAATQGVAYSVQMAATGGVPPYTWSQIGGSLPAGIAISSPAGIISGTPTTIGTTSATLQVADSLGTTASGSFSIAVSCVPLAITSGLTLPVGTQSQAYSNQLASSGGTGAKSWSLVGGSLPTGVTLSGAGLVAGTPSTSGTFSPQIRVTDSCSTPQTATSTFTLVINPSTVPLQITTGATLPSATINTAYNVTLSATGGTPPYGSWTVTVGTLPTGLSLGSSTGIISGTPTVAGSSSFTVRVADAVAATATKAFTLVVNAATGAYNPHCTSNNTITNLAQDGPALPLAACINTAIANTPSPGAVVNVTANSCASLQAAVNAAVAGVTIKVPPGTYTSCPITLAASGTASNWITLETSSTSNLPAEGSRISPAWIGVTSLLGRPAYSQPGTPGTYLPTIVANGPTIVVSGNFWRLIGLHPTTTNGVSTAQVVQQSAAGTHIIFDRMVINGGNSPTGQDKDSVQAAVRFIGCASCAVIDSYLYDTHCIAGNSGTCGDSQGIFLGGSGSSLDGPIKVSNNFIETSGEEIFSGGGGQGTATLPASDVEVMRNHLFKPLFWKSNDPSFFGTHFIIKNGLEYKNTVRSLIEGNIIENNWVGQSDQHGVLVLLDSRNQNLSITGTASSNGTGTLTWLTGAHFTSNVVGSTCATPLHCTVTYNGVKYAAQTFISTSQITVSPAPPTLASGSFSQAEPGLNPVAAVTDMTFRYNYIRHASNGMQISNPKSDNGDPSALNTRFTVHDLVMDDIDGARWNSSNDCCSYGAAFQIQNFEGGAAQLDNISIWHNTLLPTYSTGGSGSVAASFGFGSIATGTSIGHLRMYDNIAAGGWWTGTPGQGCNLSSGSAAQVNWNCWVPVAQKCWDNNFMTTSTVNASGTGSFTHNNPPYPAIADNGFCSYGAAKGNTIATGNYALPQFTNLNGANGGNYQLLVTSPWHNKASDGTDPGVNWNLFQQNIAGVQ